MSIGILCESREWSNTRLVELIQQSGVECHLIDMEDAHEGDSAFFRLYVNRVFPSAFMRGHHNALPNTDAFLAHLDDQGIPVINNRQAFQYDCSKDSYYRELTKKGVSVPKWTRVNPRQDSDTIMSWDSFPAIVKLDCGGRSFQVEIFENSSTLSSWSPRADDATWLVQEYIEPTGGFTTRVEIVGDEIIGVFKRFLGEGGFSSYSRDSDYARYPDCSEDLLRIACETMNLLGIEMGGLDFIENGTNTCYLIDINPSSNFTPDLNPLYGFDPVEKMAAYILHKWNHLD